jgi:hypothetical protein
MDPNKTDAQRLAEVADALQRVPQETCQALYEHSRTMTSVDIIRTFNQKSRDLFALLIEIARANKINHSINSYQMMFENAITVNSKLPIDKFTLVILKYAPEIYSEEEEHFLRMTVPDAQVSVGNAYGIIRSEAFRNIWLSADDDYQSRIKECVILLTTYAQIYLYKTQ